MLLLMFKMDSPYEMRLTFVRHLVPKLLAFKKSILMQDPDPKCRYFVFLWHFGIFAKRLIV